MIVLVWLPESLTTCVGNGDQTVTVPRHAELSTQFTGILTQDAGIFGLRAMLFRDLIYRPDVENPEIIKEGEGGNHTDRRDQILVVRTKSAVAVHAKSSGRRCCLRASGARPAGSSIEEDQKR